MLSTFPPSLSILLLAMSLCWLHTHALKFFILETSIYTTLTGSNPPTLMLGELRLFISLFLTSWNKLSNILHMFLIVMTMQQTWESSAELKGLVNPLIYNNNNAANTFDLFFTSNSQNYTYTVSSPLGSSDHCTVSVTSSFTPPPPIPPTQRHLWHFENAQHADISNFRLDFPWNDCCFGLMILTWRPQQFARSWIREWGQTFHIL